MSRPSTARTSSRTSTPARLPTRSGTRTSARSSPSSTRMPKAAVRTELVPRRGSAAEEDLDDVAVLHPVGLALGAELARLLRLGHRAEAEQVLVRDGLRADEALGEVGMDGARSVDRGRAVVDRPGPDLVGARCQERDQSEEPVAERDHAVEAGLGDPELLHEHRGIARLELAELHLDPGR